MQTTLKPTVKFEKTKAHQRYKDSKGTVLPGVTTVLGVLNKPALIHWAWDLGIKGIDYKKVSSGAADVGTLAHFLCECHLKGVQADLSEFSASDVSTAENCFLKFLDYWDSGKFQLVASESQISSEKLRFGGTIDCVARDSKGMLVLIDLKTSKAIYEEYWHQVVAYAQLWNETHEEKITKCVIVRIGKAEVPDLEYQERSDLTLNWKMFLACLEIYNLQKQLKK